MNAPPAARLAAPLRLLPLLLATAACAPEPAPRRADAGPDLMLVVLEGPPVPGLTAPSSLDRFVEAEVVHTDPVEGWRALLTGQWPGTRTATAPNTVHGVLRLYGYAVHHGESDLLDAVFEKEPSLREGIGAPIAAGCLREQVAAAKALNRGPQGDPLLIVLPARPSPDCDGVGGLTAGLEAAARWGTERGHALLVVGLSGGEPGAPLETAPERVPLWFRGQEGEPHDRPGLCSALDVLPTLLAVGRAVVPTDAAGQELTQLRRNPKLGAAALFQQDPAGGRVALTPVHRLYLPGGALPAGAPLPEAPPEALRLQTLIEDPRDPAAVRAALYGTLRAWERSVHGEADTERIGSDALRKTLAEQGYFR